MIILASGKESKIYTASSWQSEWADHGSLIYKGDESRVSETVRMVGTGKRVLDIGCFNGTVGKLLIDNGNEVYGVDVYEKGLKEAAKKGLITKNFDVATGGIPFENMFFDCIVAGAVIEHIFDTDFFLKECWRVLKPTGILIISTPNFASLRDRILMISGRLQAHSVHIDHIRFFNVSKLKAYLVKNNFDVEELVGTDIEIPYFPKRLLRIPIKTKILQSLATGLVVKSRKIK